MNAWNKKDGVSGSADQCLSPFFYYYYLHRESGNSKANLKKKKVIELNCHKIFYYIVVLKF